MLPRFCNAGCCIVFLFVMAIHSQSQAATESQEKLFNHPIRSQWDLQSSKLTKFKTSWKPVTGKWSILPEPEHPANRILRQAEIQRRYQRLASQQTYTNFMFSARMRTDTTHQQTKNWQIGILYRWVSDNEYYKLRITAANIALSRASEGAVSSTPTAVSAVQVMNRSADAVREDMLLILPLGAGHNQWHTLTVFCKGERMTISLDGRAIRTLSDPGLGSGKLGLFSYKTQAFFDDLQLEYEKSPEFKEGVYIASEAFRPLEDHELLIYYMNPKTGPVNGRILEEHGRPFALLSQEVHHAGLNSFIWDGQGMTGERPKPGRYELELILAGKRVTRSIRVE